MSGTLYIVATPIGNLEDITLRAIRILKEVDVILAEDTRKTGNLLKHYDIVTRTVSYHAHSGDKRKQEVVERLIKGENIALVTDAGTPGISDPGNELIDYILHCNPSTKVVPVPGASAMTALASVCGLNVSKFVFLGFLPKKKLKKRFEWIQNEGMPFIYYESPHRVLKSLAVIKEFFGSNAQVVVGRELTKIYEEVIRGTLEEVELALKTTDKRGEYVILVVPHDQKFGKAVEEPH